MTVSYPLNDYERLEALYEYGVLDSPAEESFDRLTKRAAELFDAPWSLISLVDRERQWVKSCYGLGIPLLETPRDIAFCAYTILTDQPLVVLDATTDDRFRFNPLVTGEPHIRFYVGVPLLTAGGYAVGSLCILGPKPRPAPDSEKLRILEKLSVEVVEQLDFFRARNQLNVLSRNLQDRNRQIEQQELRLKDAQHLASLALESGRMGYYQRNFETGKVTWSPDTHELFGHPQTEPPLSYEKLLMRIHPEDRAIFVAGITNSDTSGSVNDLEYRIVLPDGKIRWLASRGKSLRAGDGVPHISGVVWNITEKRVAEEKIRKSEELFRALNSACPVGIFRANSEGSFEYVNLRLVQICGLQEEEALGLGFQKCIHPDDREQTLQAYRSAFAACREYEGDCRLLLPDGSVRWVCVRAVLSGGATSELSYIVGTVEDVTARHLVSEELYRAKEQAERADRIKSEFLANMSHEIRTPLNAVLGILSLLLDTELTSEQRELVAIAESSGESLLHLLTDLLDITQVEAGILAIERLPFDLRRAIHECAGLFRAKAEHKGLALEISYADELSSHFVGDADRVRQIVLNFVSNAVKFTSKGKIVISSRLVDAGDSSSMVRIAISDTGIGIPEAAQDRLFSRFMQVDSSTTRRFGGTGLGLFICKQLAERMCGSVGFITEVDRGSQFWVDLPLLRVNPIAGH